MTHSAVVLTVAGLYLVACLVIGMLPSRKSSDSAAGYVAGDRSLGLLVMYFITGATVFSAFAFLGAPGRAYTRGAAVFYILAYGGVGFLPFYFLGPRASRLGREYGFVTQAEMVATRFRSRSLAGLMALISAIALIPYLAVQVKGAGLVLAAMTQDRVPPPVGAAIVYGVVLIYVMRSGVLGVGWTNTFQGIFMMILAWGLGLYLPYRLYGGIEPMFRQIASEKPELLAAPGLTSGGARQEWGMYTSHILLSIVGFCAWPQLFMKAFTARDERTIRRTVVLYPTFQIFLVPVIILGFAGVLFPTHPAQPDQILPHMLMNVDLPSVLVGLFCAGALAASMSTGDAILHACSSILVRDGLVSALGVRLDPRRERTVIRVLLLFPLAIAYPIAVIYRGSLVDLLLFAYGPITQITPALVATLYWKRATHAGVLAGMLGGIVTTIALDLAFKASPLPIGSGVFGLAVNLTLLIGVSLLLRKRTDSEEQRFLSVAEGESMLG